jgi:hypothetical protein
MDKDRVGPSFWHNIAAIGLNQIERFRQMESELSTNSNLYGSKDLP